MCPMDTFLVCQCLCDASLSFAFSAITFASIIDEQMLHLRSVENQHLVRPFSLFVLDGMLDAVSQIHEAGFTHSDLSSMFNYKFHDLQRYILSLQFNLPNTDLHTFGRTHYFYCPVQTKLNLL